MGGKRRKLQAGDWVEVRTKEEILRSLDKRGQLEGLPFMPQMFQYCGKRFQIYKRAHKTCDTVSNTRGRRFDGVHLEIRCDGAAYGGCQAGCLIFWRDAWLKQVDGEVARPYHRSLEEQLPDHSSTKTDLCTEGDVWAGTRLKPSQEEDSDAPTYVCQATSLLRFTMPLPWWDMRQYLEDYISGNVTLGKLLRGLFYASYIGVSNAGIGLGRPMRWFYDLFQSIWGGIPYPRKRGLLPIGRPTPTCTLNLQPGELVRIKSFDEIIGTINTQDKNLGLRFDAEMVPFCGGTYRVKTRLTRFINEQTGRLVNTQNPAIILDGVWCQARYTDCRMQCPRSIYSWWREIWLERVSDPAAAGTASQALGSGRGSPV